MESRIKFKRLLGDDGTVDSTEEGPDALLLAYDIANRVCIESARNRWHPWDLENIICSKIHAELSRMMVLEKNNARTTDSRRG